MNSVVELRSPQVRITDQQNKATVLPPSNAGQSGATSSRVAHAGRPMTSATPGQYSASGVSLQRTQQQVTTSQVARQALGMIGKELQLMKRELTQSLSTASITLPVASERATQHQHTIRQILDGARVDGSRVLDTQLNVHYDREPNRTFTIPGLDLKRHRQQAELVRIEFPGQGTALLQFNPQVDDKRLARQMDRDLVPLGLRVQSDTAGQLLFSTSDGAYQKMQQQVMVTGQGHRYPAGQANLITTHPEPEGVEDLNVVLKSRDAVRQTLTGVNTWLRQVQQSVDTIKGHQSQLVASAEARPHSPSDTETIQKKLTVVSQARTHFTSTYQALSAQANVPRHTVVALLS
ncbi:flagellin [Vibrio albus]|uniref:flagellin n=1 Tax=Vibrio albus TaxID=2200953 RepID=UPI0011B24D2B|nr:flagellin [Vibrio albus]